MQICMPKPDLRHMPRRKSTEKGAILPGSKLCHGSTDPERMLLPIDTMLRLQCLMSCLARVSGGTGVFRSHGTASAPVVGLALRR